MWSNAQEKTLVCASWTILTQVSEGIGTETLKKGSDSQARKSGERETLFAEQEQIGFEDKERICDKARGNRTCDESGALGDP